MGVDARHRGKRLRARVSPRRWRALAAILAVLAGVVVAVPATPASAATLPSGFVEETVVSGLSQPVAMEWLPDGRFLVAEKAGVVKLIDPATSSVVATVLDIRPEVNTYNDRGLLGLAADPDFSSNGYVYVLYTYDPPETADASSYWDGNSSTTRQLSYGERDGRGHRVSRLDRIQLDASTGYTTTIGGRTVILGGASTWNNLGDPFSWQSDTTRPWTCADYAPGPGVPMEIVSADSGKLLSVDQGSPGASNVVIWADVDASWQQWTVEDVGDDLVRVVSTADGRVLSVDGAATAGGATAVVETWTDGTHQKWSLHAPISGTGFSLVAAHSGLTLDVTGAASDDGTDIIQWTAHGGPNQRWLLPHTPIADCIPSDGGSHSIGSLRFAASGDLFVSMGDAASYNNVDARATRALLPDWLVGKILRIDAATGRGVVANPTYEGDGSSNRSKVFASGYRNPFRFTIDPATDLPLVGDVGWGRFEELNAGPAGASYGWPCYEGGLTTAEMAGGTIEGPGTNIQQPSYDDIPECAPFLAGGQTPPVYTWCRGSAGPSCPGGGHSAMAGTVYQGTTYPLSYSGLWFGDVNAGWIKVIDTGFSLPAVPVTTDVALAVDMSTGPETNVYYVSITGSVHRIRYVGGGNVQPVAVASATPTNGNLPLPVQFTGSESYDPDVEPLTYEWDFGDGASSTEADPAHVYTTAGSFDAVLTVTDGAGATDQVTVPITVGNNAPSALITTPASDITVDIGTSLTFVGEGSDPEEGALTGAALVWTGSLHHNDHTHEDVYAATGTNPPPLILDDHDDDTYLEICLTAVDSDGLTGSDCVDIRPTEVTLTLETDPPGLDLVYNGQEVTTPFSFQVPVNTTRAIGATSPQGQYSFDSWNIGGPASQNIVIGPADQTLTATFTGVSPQSETLYVSSTSPVSVDGVTYDDSDILAYDAAAGTWSMFFDASTVGMVDSTTDIDAFHVNDDGSIAFSIVAEATLGTLGTVDDSDIVSYDPATGTWGWVLDGSTIELDTNGEDIDAVALLPDGDIVFSTLSGYRAGGRLIAADEDLVRYNPATGAITMLFDGSDTGNTLDTNGVALRNGLLYTTDVIEQRGDVMSCEDPVVLGETTDCVVTTWLDDALSGLTGERLDGLSYIDGTPPNTPPQLVDPGPQVSDIGSSPVLQIVATDSDPGASLTYSAVGLPDGLAIDPATGLISGQVSTTTASIVEVTVHDGSVATAVAFSWAVIGAPSVGGLVHVSSTTPMTLDGVRYDDSDIATYDTTTGTWAMLLDASTIGLDTSATDIDAFHVNGDGTIVFSITADATVGALGLVDDSDLLAYDPATGSLVVVFDGSSIDLTTNGEDIDAVSILDDGDIVFSTTSTYRVGSFVVARDEDLVRYDPVSGDVSLYYDGSDTGNLNDTPGVHVDADEILLASADSDAWDDIFACEPLLLGADTICVSVLWLDDAVTGLTGERLDGISRT